MSPEQEARARELLDRTVQRVNPDASAPVATTVAPTPVPTTTPPTANDRARQEIDRLNADARAKAQEQANQRRSRPEVIRDLDKEAQAIAKTRPVAPPEPRTPPPAVAPPQNPAPAPVVQPPTRTAPPVANGTNRKPAPTPNPAQSTATTAVKTKAQRLSELLEAYRSDKITPTEYHQQRAKILAEP